VSIVVFIACGCMRALYIARVDCLYILIAIFVVFMFFVCMHYCCVYCCVFCSALFLLLYSVY